MRHLPELRTPSSAAQAQPNTVLAAGLFALAQPARIRFSRKTGSPRARPPTCRLKLVFWSALVDETASVFQCHTFDWQ